MLQPHVLSEAFPQNSVLRERAANSSALAEGEEVTATSLGRPKGERSCEEIHRAPSVEEVTATSLGTPTIAADRQKINRKRAPNELSLRCYRKITLGG